MLGYNSTDDVFLDQGVGATGLITYQFVAISYLYDKDFELQSNGFLGLSRFDPEYSIGPLYVEELKKANKVTKEAFSMYLDKSKDDYFADFGQWDVNNVKNNDANNIAWIDVPAAGYFWYAAAVQAVQIGENEYTNQGRTAGYRYSSTL